MMCFKSRYLLPGFAIVMMCAGAIVGCGIDFKVGNGGTRPGNLAEETVATIDETLVPVMELEELAVLVDDSGGFVPGIGTDLDASLQLKQNAPALQMAAVSDRCGAIDFDGTVSDAMELLPDDGICSVIGDVERVSFYFPPDAVAFSDVRIIDFSAMGVADRATSITRLDDLQAANGTTDADLWHHDIALVRGRYATESQRLRSRVERLHLNVQGCPADQRDSPLCDPENDGQDLLFSYGVDSVFSDGNQVEITVTPDQPVPLDRVSDRLVSGEYEERTIFSDANARLNEEIQRADFDFENQMVTYTRELVFRDGRNAEVTLRLQGGTYTYHEKRANGRVLTARVSRAQRTFSRTITYEPGHDRVMVVESGELKPLSLQVHRQTTFADASTSVQVIDVARTNRTSTWKIATWSDNVQASAEFTITRNTDGRQIVGTILGEKEDEIEFEAVQARDRNLELNFRRMVGGSVGDDDCDADSDTPGRQQAVGYLSGRLDLELSGTAGACGDGASSAKVFSVSRDEQNRIGIQQSENADTPIRRDIGLGLE